MSISHRHTDPVFDAGVRRRLIGTAYRLLGSFSEAEDAVQDAYLRWYGLPSTDRASIETPAAWLTVAVSRIALDTLRSARSRRVRYVGPWLPEPLPADVEATMSVAQSADDPLERVALDESISMAVLTLLERLTPPERVSLVLHDVFAVPYEEIARITGRAPGACRQLASSARRRLREHQRVDVSTSDLQRSVSAFRLAWETGELDALVDLLATTAVATVDGGGQVSAPGAPVIGAKNVAAMLLAVHEGQSDLALHEAVVNGRPGLVARDADGCPLATVSFALRGERIEALWVVRNPNKLTLWTLASATSSPPWATR